MSIPVTTTQSRYPWRAVLRTALASVPLVALLVAEVAEVVDPDASLPLTGAALSATLLITRLLALPSVNALLLALKVTAPLAAAPKPDPNRPLEYDENDIPTNL